MLSTWSCVPWVPRGPDHYLVHGGEVLFKSRGHPSTAAVVSTLLGEPAVVILPLLILRPHGSLVCADYLAWAVNQPDAQRRLNREAQGTSLRMVPKAVLERLDVPLPDLDTQRRIAAVHPLTQQEGHLLRQLAQHQHHANDRPEDHPAADQPDRLGRLRHRPGRR